MKEKITDDTQGIVIFRLNPNERDLDGSVSFDRNVHGRTLSGHYYIQDHALIVTDEYDTVKGVFSLHHFYFLKTGN
jgi:hypothetical protein